MNIFVRPDWQLVWRRVCSIFQRPQWTGCEAIFSDETPCRLICWNEWQRFLAGPFQTLTCIVHAASRTVGWAFWCSWWKDERGQGVLLLQASDSLTRQCLTSHDRISSRGSMHVPICAVRSFQYIQRPSCEVTSFRWLRHGIHLRSRLWLLWRGVRSSLFCISSFHSFESENAICVMGER